MRPGDVEALRKRLLATAADTEHGSDGLDRLRSRIWKHVQAELGVPSDRRSATSADTGDRALAARVRGGDAAAFDQLFGRYGGRHLAYAKRSLQPADAENAVQDAWLDLLRKRADLPDTDDLAAFLHGFVRVAVLRALRPRVLAEPLPDEMPAETADGHELEPVVRAVERDRDLRRLDEAVADLDPLAQEVILLSLEGMKPAAIAEKLELTPGHVRVLKHRVKARLARVLGEVR